MKKISMLMAALLAFAFVATAATAAKPETIEVDSEITLKFKEGGDGDEYYEQGEDDLFSGKVSAKKKCQEDRKVKVFAKKGGRVGKDKTNEQGRYSISVKNAGPGKYFAEVKKRTYKNKKGTKKIVCQAASSDKVTVG